MKPLYYFLPLLLLSAATTGKGQSVATYCPIDASHIQVEASSQLSEFPATALLSEQGMVRNRLLKNNTGRNMWISMPTTNQEVWLRFTLDKAYPVDAVQIWNHNQNDHTRRGLCKVCIRYTEDGNSWQTLTDGNRNYFIIPESGGQTQQPADLLIPLQGRRIRGLSITADKTMGNYYHAGDEQVLEDARLRSQNIHYYALGKIRFLQKKRVPVGSLPPVHRFLLTASQGYLRSPQGATRPFLLSFDQPLYADASITLTQGKQSVVRKLKANPAGIYEAELTFMPGYMETEQSVRLQLTSPQGHIDSTLVVPAARKWELYFLPHSHQDIGYTHLQHEVMLRQWRNIERAVALIERTADYPPAARFRWNSEATWALAAYLDTHRGSERAERLKAAIRSGRFGVDASLGSMLTGICKQEELMHLFDDAHRIEQETGTTFPTVMFSDVTGAVWGMTTAFAHNGIRYFSSAPNYTPDYPAGGSRLGYMHPAWGDRPFYWASPSGKDKVLHWATGTGYSLFHGWLYGRLNEQHLQPIWTVLQNLEQKAYPYPLTYMRYTIHGDNGPPDPRMPDIIRQWNERYEYPKFHIATTREVFETFEQRYGATLPTYSGDLSPFWEDGAASTARELGINRWASERLNQAEVLWSMTQPPALFPADALRQGWKYAALFSEHTWGASNSWNEPYAPSTVNQWNEKASYALRADSIGKALIDKALPRTGEGSYVQVFNTLSWERTAFVTFQSKRDLSDCMLTDGQEQSIALQKLIDGSWGFVATHLPALSAGTYTLRKRKGASPPASICYASSDSLNNGHVSLRIDPRSGNIIALSFAPQPDNVAAGDGLNAFIHTGRNAAHPQGVSRVRCSLVENGPVRYTIRIEADAPGCNSLTRDVSVVAGLSKVFISNTVDKADVLQHENLRFFFPLAIKNSEIAFDTPFALVYPERQQLEGANRNYFCINNGLVVSNYRQAVVLNTVDAPFVELGDMSGEAWMMPGHPRTDWRRSAHLLPAIYSWVMNNSWGTNYRASQPGLAVFRYELSVCPIVREILKVSEVKRKGMEMAQPPLAYLTNRPMQVEPLLTIPSGNEIAISTIRPEGDGYMVRLVNLSDRVVGTFLPNEVREIHLIRDHTLSYK